MKKAEETSACVKGKGILTNELQEKVHTAKEGKGGKRSYTAHHHRGKKAEKGEAVKVRRREKKLNST